MQIDGHCPGCGKYPCQRYDGITQLDSFITHRHQLLDMAKMSKMGMAEYHFELEQKLNILKYLLENYNDGRRKTFFYLVVNLFSLTDSRNVVQQIKERINGEMIVKEKATVAVERFDVAAKEKDMTFSYREQFKVKE